MQPEIQRREEAHERLEALTAQRAELRRNVVLEVEVLKAADTAVEAAQAALTLGEGDAETVEAATAARLKARDVARGTAAAIKTLDGRIAKATEAHEQAKRDALVVASSLAAQRAEELRETIIVSHERLCRDLREWARLEELGRGNAGFRYQSGVNLNEQLGIASAEHAGRAMAHGIELAIVLGMADGSDRMGPDELAAILAGEEQRE